MTVLSILESTPNRVRALTRLVASVGPATRETLREYFMPDGGDEAAQFGNLMRETLRLDLLEERGGTVSLANGLAVKDVTSDSWFLRHVEMMLLQRSLVSGENKAFPYALAWLLEQPPGRSIPWHSDQHLEMRKQMEGGDDYEVTNKSRFAMLCYWGRFLGFVTGLDLNKISIAVPDPTEAINRSLPGVFQVAGRLTVARFLDSLANDYPVLETGTVRRTVEERLRARRQSNQLSAATSVALWRLEKRKRLRIAFESDADAWLMCTSVNETTSAAPRRISHLELVGSA